MSALPPLNPVLSREVKERLRSRRATTVITIYLGVLSLLLYVIYRTATQNAASGFADPMASQAATLGRLMFETVLLVMLGLVLFIVPGLTADAVTGERERQTLVPLQVSLLRPRSILLGKLLASVAFTALLVVATLPLFGISFIIGGVSVGQVVRGVVAVLVVALVAGAVTLWCSSLVRRTQAAIVLAYFMMFVLVAGSTAVYGMQVVFSRQQAVQQNPGEMIRDPRPTTAVLHLNPFLTTADFVAVPGDGMGAPLQSIADFIRRQEGAPDERFVAVGGFVEEEVVVVEEEVVATTVADGEAVADGEVEEERVEEEALAVGAADGDDRSPISFWIRSTLVLTVVAVGAFVLAARRIRTPSDRTAM